MATLYGKKHKGCQQEMGRQQQKSRLRTSGSRQKSYRLETFNLGTWIPDGL